MQIKIDDYEIGSDGRCITIYKKGTTKNGKEQTQIVGHYSNTIQALDRFLEEKIADSTAETIEQLREDILKVQEIIRKVCK